MDIHFKSFFNPPLASFLKKRRILLKMILNAWIVSFVLLSGMQLGHAKQISKWEWEGIDRIVAIGDIHGSYDKFVILLKGTGLVDENLSWTGGNAHLVMVGDLVDRGKNDRGVVELVMRLQNEASSAGGQVHALLGNHDVMVLAHDLRYVHKKSYEDFATDEDPADREKAWKGFKSAYSRKGISEAKLQAAFDETFPPGFFAHLKLFDLEGTFGAWSLSRPVVIKINGIVFVHGGLTEEVASLGLDEINSRIKKNIIDFVKYSETLEPLVKGPATFDDIVKIAYEIENRVFQGRKNRKHEQAAKELIELLDSMLFAPDGPLWYRGNSLENERFERPQIEFVLDHLDAEKLVVGHTPTGEGQVTSRFNVRLFRVDVGKVYGRKPYCIEFEGNNVKVFNPQTMAYESPSQEPYHGQEWTKIHVQLPDREVEKFLKKAEVKKIIKRKFKDRYLYLVELERDELHIRALFLDFDEKPPKGKKDHEVRLRKYQHEAAAYWLDRRLDLRMVPVTVTRKIKGKRGGLQILMESAFDLTWLEEQNMVEETREEYKEQVDKAFVFGALLDVVDRPKEGIMVLPDERRIMLSGSTLAFSHSPKIQERFLPEIKCPINPALEYELRTLNRKELKKNLKDYLSDGQIDALLKRRDHILELCAGNNQ
jgi:hypothetical protein